MSTLNRRTLPTVLAAMSASAIVSDTAPLHPNVGAIWFDTVAGALKVWDGSAWNVAEVDTTGIADGAIDDTKIADGTISESKLSFVLPDGTTTVTVAATAPTSPNLDDLWIDTSSDSTLKRWDGSAWVAYQFGTGAVSFNARDLGGVATTIAASAPASPLDGDLWLDSASDYQLNRWDGSTWAAVTFGTSAITAGSITAALIAANTITAAQIAAGTITATELAANSVTASQIAAGAITAAKIAAGVIYAGIVDGTTITGAQFVAHGTSGEILVYNGTPAAGNLVLAISGSTGTDAFGNAYQIGVTIPQLAFSQGAISFPVSTWGTPGFVTAAFTGGDTGYLLLSSPSNGIPSHAADISLSYNSTTGKNAAVITADTVTVNGAAVMPSGIVQMYAGSSVPTGWLLCDGSSQLRATYPDLFTAIGTAYGSVDGTHFTLPDFTNSFPRGNTRAQISGVDTHTHTSAAHSHTLSDAGQAEVNSPATNSMSIRRVASSSWDGNRQMTGTAQTASTGEAFGAALTGSTDSATPGATGSSPHIPVHTGIQFIIKT